MAETIVRIAAVIALSAMTAWIFAAAPAWVAGTFLSEFPFLVPAAIAVAALTVIGAAHERIKHRR